MSQAIESIATLEEAKRLFGAGQFAQAATALQGWLDEHPGDPDAYHALGVCYAELGQPALAATLLEQALRLRPNSSRYRASLSVVLGVAGDRTGAQQELERGRAEDPDSTPIRLESGLACLCSGSGEEAIEHFTRVLVTEPSHTRALLGVALATALAGRLEDARAALNASSQDNPAVHPELVLLGKELEARGQTADAVELMSLGLELGVRDPELTYRVAVDRGEAFSRAPDAYVEKYFDRFAMAFDSVLVDRLRYGIPELICEAVARHAREGALGLTVLDGGCGTGLCGPLLRPLAATLVGVDLSQGMLERARERGSYDELEQAELAAALRARPREIDVVVCADVLVYFGDLEEFFTAAEQALRPEGLLAVSVERQDGGTYTLQRSGRFAHGEGYLRETAARAGLRQVESAPCEVRLERGESVPGLIGVFRAQS